VNLTCCIEKRLPGYTRGDDWFGERMMNGMNRLFRPRRHAGWPLWMRYFGSVGMTSTTLRPARYRRPLQSQRRRTAQSARDPPDGRLNRSDHESLSHRVFSAADGDAWPQAKTCRTRHGSLLHRSGGNFAATHLNTEQYAISAYRNLRLNPVAGLLLPI